MPPYISLVGASGAVYRFLLAPDARPQSPVSGLYVYVARAAGDQLSVVYAADAVNLRDEARVRWDDAVAAHKVVGLYYRLNVARAARQAELADLLPALAPVMG